MPAVDLADSSIMWPWIALGWIALAVAAAAAHHRLRRLGWRLPDEICAFLERLRRDLAQRHESVRWCGVVPGRFTAVLGIDGQEIPVPLHAVYRHYLAFPEVFSHLVDRLVTDVTEEGLDSVVRHEFSLVATRILPQVRTEEWVRSNAPVFGPAALVNRPFGSDLVVCYVIDDDWTMSFVTECHLKRWGRTEEDLYHLSTRNLHRLASADLSLPSAGDDPVLVKHGDGYDASRLLLLDTEEADDLLVAIPERDTLWLARSASGDLADLMRLNAEQSERSAHPVSPRLYRIAKGGEIEAVDDRAD